MTIDSFIHVLAWSSAAAGFLLVGLALLSDRPRGRRRCPRCWYDLSKTSGRQCSECGHAPRTERSLLRARRHWRFATLGLLVMLGAWLGGSWPGIDRDGWAAAFPTAVLQPALPAFAQHAQSLIDAHAPGGWTRWDRLIVAARVRDCVAALPHDSVADLSECFWPLNSCGVEARLAANAVASAATTTASNEVRRFCTLALLNIAPDDPRLPDLLTLTMASTTDFNSQVSLVDELNEVAALWESDPYLATRLCIAQVQSPIPYAVRQGALQLINCGNAAAAALPALRGALAASDDEGVKDDIRMVIDAIEHRRY